MPAPENDSRPTQDSAHLKRGTSSEILYMSLWLFSTVILRLYIKIINTYQALFLEAFGIFTYIPIKNLQNMTGRTEDFMRE